MNINTYTEDIHDRCKRWANFITDGRRSLQHRAALARFIHNSFPEISHQVGMLVQIKSLIQIQNATNRETNK